MRLYVALPPQPSESPPSPLWDSQDRQPPLVGRDAADAVSNLGGQCCGDIPPAELEGVYYAEPCRPAAG
jgi:hypothetical protein